jgi:hypothetical protein
VEILTDSAILQWKTSRKNSYVRKKLSVIVLLLVNSLYM